jgi:hypothetical protein
MDEIISKKTQKILLEKLSLNPPKILRESVFDKISTPKNTFNYSWATALAGFFLIAIISFWNLQKSNTNYTLDNSAPPSIELIFIVENQELLAEFNPVELEESEWDLLVGNSI